MQDKEGGTYTPDTQEDEDSIGTARLRPLGAAKTEQAPLTLIISGIFLVILLLLVVIFYNSKLSSNRLPSELGAEIGAYKDAKVIEAKPINEDDLINNATSSDAATKMAPDSQAPSSVAPSSASATSPVAATSAPPVVNAAASPEIQAALTPKTTPQPLPAQPPALKPAVSAPAPKPVAVAPKPVTPAPVAVAKPTPAPVAPKPVAAATGGGYAVQIGAFGSDAIANQQLGAIAQPSGASKTVEKVDVNGKTYYRASFKGFASKDQAKAFCDKLKGAGKTCFVK